MKVMLADIETDAVAAALESLHEFAPCVRGVTCDVADPVSVEEAARASYEAFGNVHVVCNNAGTGGGLDNFFAGYLALGIRCERYGSSRHKYLRAAH
jgi:NAD(P)-dependent dehydrogenase (short-subunit alcohol dehydrogenase family)